MEAMPGDIIDYGGGYRRIVRYVRTLTVRKYANCNCCWTDTDKLEVFVDAEDPEEVILKGGGVALVLPLVLLPDEWPPKALVYRNGQLVHGEVAPEGDWTVLQVPPPPAAPPDAEWSLEPDELKI